jgi:regulator of PEP synthase PpsR (kinase-PPPase family)
MSTQKKTAPERPRTLMQAHTALVAIRPKSTASLGAWKTYYERSVALYREIAEIDRGHHHEALYWADREQKSADEIAARISAGQSQEHPHTERR